MCDRYQENGKREKNRRRWGAGGRRWPCSCPSRPPPGQAPQAWRTDATALHADLSPVTSVPIISILLMRKPRLREASGPGRAADLCPDCMAPARGQHALLLGGGRLGRQIRVAVFCSFVFFCPSQIFCEKYMGI